MATPFCCNVKCPYHHKLVPKGVKHLFYHEKAGPFPTPADLAKTSDSATKTFAADILLPMPGPGYKPVHAAFKQVRIDRHMIQWSISGQYIDDYLCDVCYEVFRMLDI